MKATRFLVVVLAWLCISAQAQDDYWKRIAARVIARSGDVLTLDVGTDDGVRIGDGVLLFPQGEPTIRIKIESCDEQSARVLLNRAIDLDTRVEVLVPKQRTDPARPNSETPLPWSRPAEDWDPDMPLLAPVSSPRPQERESRFFGRTHIQLDSIRDSESDSSNHLARAGADVLWENALGQGGLLEFDVEGFAREADNADGDGDDSTRLRIDRLSYRVGGFDGTRGRLQFGRFIPVEFPEFGLLDGAEYARFAGDGHVFGATLGWLPKPFADLDTGDDFAASLFYRNIRGENDELRLGAAYQKTWNRGTADRDLFLFSADYVPNSRFMVFGTAFVDWYTSGDSAKESGPELTELNLNSRWQVTDETGIAIAVHHFKYPDIVRNEFTPLPPTEIERNHVSQGTLSGWWQTTETLRLDARAQGWIDEDDEGGGGEVGARLRDELIPRGELGMALFFDQGNFVDINGLRLRAHQNFSKGTWRAFYELSNYDQADFTGIESSNLQHRLRASFDTFVFEDVSLSLSIERRFGDNIDATALGVFLQRSF